MSHDVPVGEGHDGGIDGRNGDGQHGPRIPGYRLFQPIGYGGYSIVYTAYQERLDRTVAVKVIGSDLRDAAAERRFTRECRAVGKLTGHPNIITVFEAGSTQDRRPFIAMQYLPAGSYTDRLAREGALGVAEVLRIGAQIADALHTAHDARILHRDIKPGNILLSDRGEPVLSDFGIASRGFDADMSVSPDVFTPAFAAPEILRGGVPTVASDVYSLGATLYNLLTGEPPFGRRPGDNAASMMLRILTEDVQPTGLPDILPEVENELRRMLSREPAERPRSAAAVADELRRLDALLGQTRRRTPPSPVGTPDFVVPGERQVPPVEPHAVPPPSHPPISGPPTPIPRMAGTRVPSCATPTPPVPGSSTSRTPTPAPATSPPPAGRTPMPPPAKPPQIAAENPTHSPVPPTPPATGSSAAGSSVAGSSVAGNQTPNTAPARPAGNSTPSHAAPAAPTAGTPAAGSAGAGNPAATTPSVASPASPAAGGGTPPPPEPAHTPSPLRAPDPIRAPAPIRPPDPTRVPVPREGAPVPAPGGRRSRRGRAGGRGDAPPSPPGPTAERRRYRGLMVAVIVLGVIVAVFVAAAIFAPSRDETTDADTPASVSASPPRPPTIAPAEVAAARPRELKASEAATAATLTWKNGSASENLVIQLSDTSGLGAVQALPQGAAVYEVTDLDPAKGYCFRVGAILGGDPATGAVVGWSDYACIRGANPPA